MGVFEDLYEDGHVTSEEDSKAGEVIEWLMNYPFWIKWEEALSQDSNPEVDEKIWFLLSQIHLLQGQLKYLFVLLSNQSKWSQYFFCFGVVKT